MSDINRRKRLQTQLANFESGHWQAFELGYGVRRNVTPERIASLKCRIAKIDSARGLRQSRCEGSTAQ